MARIHLVLWCKRVVIMAIVASGIAVVVVQAYTPVVFHHVETEDAVAGNNSRVVDHTASDGQAIRFGSGASGGSEGNYPSYETTGPRVAPTSTSGSIVTTYHGQVIEGVTVNGSIEVRHNDVTIRDVVIMGTGNYALDIGQNTTPCPSNVFIEYTEINMSNAPAELSMPFYDRCAGGTRMDHLRIHGQGRGTTTYGNIVVTNSWIHNQRTYAEAHRSAFSTHGGDNYRVVHNTFICEQAGCSAAVVMYSDYLPVTNYLLEDNLVAGGSICVRAGESHSFPTETHDIRIINNRFSTRFYPECGSLQAFAMFDENAPGNVRSGNVFHESGLPIPGE